MVCKDTENDPIILKKNLTCGSTLSLQLISEMKTLIRQKLTHI